MTAFLVVLVILLFGVAVMQMGKIMRLANPEIDPNAEIANDKDNNINGYLMLGFVIFIYVLCIISFYKWSDVLLPESASEHGLQTDQLWLISMVASSVGGKYRPGSTTHSSFQSSS